MNEGKYIYTQVTQLMLRQIFQRLLKKYNGDYRVREFDCTNQFKYMLFGQLFPCESLRDICLCLSKHQKILYGLSMTASINESTLSRTNESRDYRIYEGLGQALISIVLMTATCLTTLMSSQRSSIPWMRLMWTADYRLPSAYQD